MTKRETHIGLAHGNGGRLMRQLIDEVFARHLGNKHLDTRLDSTFVPFDGNGTLAMTTDGFTVQPLEYPGGNIGSLAIHGTVNDLIVAGASPRYLSLNAFIEEGIEMAQLERLIEAMAQAARDSEVEIVTGDTKVVGRNECGGVYFATTGVGERYGDIRLGPEQIRPGDRILVTGPVGDHGAAVMLARGEFGLHGDLESDSASVIPAAKALMDFDGLRFMRDPTRGGLATVANELVRLTGFGVRLREESIPIRDSVAAVCEVLGFDPLYLACEGRIVAILSPDAADEALAALAGIAPESRVIGEIESEAGPVVMETGLGGERILDELEDDPLPRIC